MAASTVDVIMPAEAYQKLVEHTAKPWQDWSGTASLGYSIQSRDQLTNTFSTTLAAKLSNRFSLNAGVIDLYLSNPAVGSRKNNVAFTTGLGYTF